MLHKQGFAYILLGTVSLFGFMASAPAQGQEPTALEKITVEAGGEADDGIVAESGSSATKTKTPLLKTPQSISVVTRKQIEQQGAKTIAEALRYTPGVSPEIRPNDRYDIVPVRGFGAYQNFVQYLDGLRLLRGLSFSQPTVDIFDLERIEVVRGPASVLYGQMSPGGFVNLVSKKPTEEDIREVDLTLGFPNYIKAAADFGGKLNEDGTLLYRLTASGRYNETNIDDITSKRVSISPSLTIKPEEGTSLTFLFNHTNDPTSSYPSYLPATGTALSNPGFADIPYDFNIGDPDFDMFKRTVTRAGYEFEHEFGDYFTFRQNLRYSHIESEQRGLTGSAISGTTITRRTSHLDETVDTFVVDNQLQADFQAGGIDHTLLFGVDYQYIDAGRLLGNGVASSIDYLNPVYGEAIVDPAFTTETSQITKQAGVYLQEQAEIGDLNLSFGGRYDRYSVETDTTLLATGVTTRAEQENGAFTGKAGATYEFDGGIAPYLSYATSFEPPAGLGYSDSGGVTLDPVKGQQAEIGIKYQPEGSGLFLMASLYDLRQQNATASDASHPGYYTQQGEIHSRGLELEAKLGLASGWDVAAAYTFIDAEITKSAADVVGNRPVTVPQHAASLWVHYTVQSGTFEGLGLGGGVRYVGSSYGADDNSFKVSAFTLADLALDYDFGAQSPDLKGLSLNVSVSNLFDEEYVASCTSALNCFYGTGRTTIATLKYTW